LEIKSNGRAYRSVFFSFLSLSEDEKFATQDVPMQYVQSPLQLKYCLANLTMGAKFIG
jgi:hypothetical protein